MIEFQWKKHFHCEFQWQKHFNDGRKLSCTHYLNLQSSWPRSLERGLKICCKLKQVLELITMTSWSTCTGIPPSAREWTAATTVGEDDGETAGGGRPVGDGDLSSAPGGPTSTNGCTACYWSGRGRPAGARA
jgi:hypothetical protein